MAGDGCSLRRDAIQRVSGPSPASFDAVVGDSGVDSASSGRDKRFSSILPERRVPFGDHSLPR